jgi:hypothetical protein
VEDGRRGQWKTGEEDSGRRAKRTVEDGRRGQWKTGEEDSGRREKRTVEDGRRGQLKTLVHHLMSKSSPVIRVRFLRPRESPGLKDSFKTDNLH